MYDREGKQGTLYPPPPYRRMVGSWLLLVGILRKTSKDRHSLSPSSANFAVHNHFTRS
jgi:hypothetical protein